MNKMFRIFLMFLVKNFLEEVMLVSVVVCTKGM